MNISADSWWTFTERVISLSSSCYKIVILIRLFSKFEKSGPLRIYYTYVLPNFHIRNLIIFGLYETFMVKIMGNWRSINPKTFGNMAHPKKPYGSYTNYVDKQGGGEFANCLCY